MTNIVWSKTGQGEFDFDFLLNLTNEDFVNVISKQLDRPNIKSIKIKPSFGLVEVIVVAISSVRVFNFCLSTSTYETIALNDDDLTWALEVMQSGS